MYPFQIYQDANDEPIIKAFCNLHSRDEHGEVNDRLRCVVGFQVHGRLLRTKIAMLPEPQVAGFCRIFMVAIP